MKSMKFAAAVVFAVVIPAAVSAQPRGPAPYDLWCRDQGLGSGGTVQMCYAFTYEQCMASRVSNRETCYLNPRYDARFKDWRARNPNF
jgi:hypothetical protein